jgi:hypothetical protein
MSKTSAHTRYKLKDGSIVRGVTTIIDQNLGWNKRILIKWATQQALAGKDPEKILEQAGDIGSIAHKLIEAHIKSILEGKKIEADLTDFSKNDIDKAENCFIAYLDWEKRNSLEYIASEMQVISEGHRYGGTIDILAKNNGKLWLIDPKSSKGIYPEFIIQVAAYDAAYQEQENKEIDEIHLLHLGKEDGSFADHKLSTKQIENGWDAFCYCRQLDDLKKRF